jgi:CheY-like chemotaxis protein
LAKIIVIDDDPAMNILSEFLRFNGHEVQRMLSSTNALEEIEKVTSADIVLLDIIMPWPNEQDRDVSKATQTAGMEVLREIRKRNPKLPVIAYSATQDGIVKEAIALDPNVRFCSKWGGPTLKELTQLINRTLGIPDKVTMLRPFIVHGHNDTIKLELKNYLQNTLKLPEPIILHEQPNGGRTLIEKFEDYAEYSSIVFVILTPDDLSANHNDTNDIKRRGRQNVVFEMGYFLGMLGRTSGRIILLYQGPLEIPSDISGIAYIEIPQGVEAAGERIRREIEHVRS